MNIFVSDPSPIVSAQNLCDKRVKHMPKETLECLIMSVHKNERIVIYPFIIWGGDDRKDRMHDLYTNPVTEWVARKRVNTWWTYRHLFALLAEYKFRFGRNHYLFDIALSLSHFFRPSSNEPKSFCNATGFDGTNIFDLYKKCLLKKWFVTDEQMPNTWTRRGAPSWVVTDRTEQMSLFIDEKKDYKGNPLPDDWEDDLPF